MNGISFANTICYNSLGARIRNNTAAYLAIAAFLDGKEFTCKSPYNIWDFTYVGDTANAVVEVLRTGYEGSVNIGRGIPVFVGDMFKLMADKLNASHLLKLDYDNHSFEAIIPDVSILNNEIGFICDTPLVKSLDITIDWIKQNRKNMEDVKSE
jgi:nucleoside-diphosphate-sugar epimerase